ncbi:MAG: hypothetical protein QXG91_01105 [Candidatus Aenigmatarchaeota archaeon]
MLSKIIEYFPIKFEAVKKVNKNLFLFEEIENFFIIHNKSCLKMACYPSIVGKSLSFHAKIAAKEFLLSLKELKLSNENFVLLNILRGCLGYELNTVFKNSKKIYILPKYEKISFRNHVGKTIKIKFKNFKEMENSKEKFSLIVADTIATGKTMIKCLRAISNFFERLEKVIFYGFMSLRGASIVKNFCDKFDLKSYFFTISNYSSLAFNNYDMILYGIDESYFNAKKVKRYLFGVCDIEVFKDMVKYYIPGLDQPGDFSSRQEILFDGRKFIDNRKFILKHCENNIRLIKTLYLLSCKEEWFSKVHESRMKGEIINLEKTKMHYESFKRKK